MQCQHVLQIIDFLRDDEFVALVTEFVEGGDLDVYVAEHGEGGGLTPAEAKEIGLQITVALVELHSNDIVHRDLKPGNILYSENRWKLADFGISKNLARLVTQKTFQQAGTPGYAAPEQFQGVTAHPSADVYSFGKLLVYLLTGQTDIDRVSYSHWQSLVQSCVDSDPDNRPTIGQAQEQLREIRT